MPGTLLHYDCILLSHVKRMIAYKEADKGLTSCRIGLGQT